MTFQFTPQTELNPRNAPQIVRVKGSVPTLRYPFTLLQLYPQVPSLSALEAYEQIRAILGNVNRLLAVQLKLRSGFLLPHASNNQEAIGIMRALLDPTSRSLENVKLTQVERSNVAGVFRLSRPRPFPLKDASPEKLLHTLAWVDTNVKVKIELAAAANSITEPATVEIAEAALTIYCLLVKMCAYELAQLINFNHSIFLQDRILNLIFGNMLLRADEIDVGRLSNDMAVQLLERIGPLSLRELCSLAVVMGVVWTNAPDAQRRFLNEPGPVLQELQNELECARKGFEVDQIDKFIVEVGRDRDETIVVILDDNGEAAFDLAVFQEVIVQTGHLRLLFVVNRYPVSTNLSLDGFHALLERSAFSRLRQSFASGRSELLIEEQAFRSFEQEYLSSQTKEALQRSAFAYIKGVNFFETLQPVEIARYYCFVVTGQNCVTLSGCHEGSGVFARVSAGCEGYAYEGPGRVTTLFQIISDEERGNSA